MESRPLSRNTAAPVCPKCGHLMTPQSRPAKRTHDVSRFGHIDAVRPPVVDIWRCGSCGIERARF